MKNQYKVKKTDMHTHMPYITAQKSITNIMVHCKIPIPHFNSQISLLGDAQKYRTSKINTHSQKEMKLKGLGMKGIFVKNIKLVTEVNINITLIELT